MQLQGRDLTTGLRGDDVKLLHSELMQLGFLIPREEVTGGLFGRETAAEVKRFQVSHRLPATGIVDTITAVAINRDLMRYRSFRGRYERVTVSRSLTV